MIEMRNSAQSTQMSLYSDREVKNDLNTQAMENHNSRVATAFTQKDKRVKPLKLINDKIFDTN